MGRPSKHSVDDFIDAGISLFAESGIRAVTLNAVAESVGATNGSIYHRFPDRPSLLAAIWLHSSKTFETAYREKLGAPTIDSAIAAAVWVVDWCRDNVEQAQVLQAGERTFGPEAWPPEARAAATTEGQIQAEFGRAVQALSASTAASPDQIAFAMIELPIAVVRRSLHSKKAPGPRESELVRDLVTAILDQPASSGSPLTSSP